MKQIIYLMVLLLLSGCTSETKIPQSFEVIDQSVDVMVMREFNEQLYLGTNEGLFIMNDDHQIQAVELIKSLSLIHTLYVAEDQRLYVGGMNGLISINESGKQTYYDASEEWLPDTRVLYVTGDESGSLYIGTFGGLGILELSGMKGSVMTVEDGLLVAMVNRIVLPEDGSLWLASYNVRNGGITRVKNNQIIYYEDELASIHITSILQLENQLYFGGGVYDEGGLTIFTKDDNDWHIESVLHEEDGFAGPKVRSLYMDRNQLYIGSEYSGLAVWEGDQLRIFTDKDGLSHNEVKCIYRYNGELLIGTRNGLSRLLE